MPSDRADLAVKELLSFSVLSRSFGSQRLAERVCDGTTGCAEISDPVCLL